MYKKIASETSEAMKKNCDSIIYFTSSKGTSVKSSDSVEAPAF